MVIYHAFPQNLPGGFVGVDIFFVISGYLISGILYKGVREEGFSFREFYARRVRRLFPVLITVLLLCLGYGYIVLLNDEYRQMGKHVAAGTLFIQNMVFWRESGYWDISSSLKPLLHLWSLAVEEQFYIIFPPLLLLFWKRRWPMVPLLWILLGASLVANLIMSYQTRVADFFLTPYRAWEFLGGSLLAWWHYGKNHEEEAPYGNILSVAGVILITLSMIVLKEKQPYPGWRAILPVVGSVMLIAAGNKSVINRWILSHPAVVWIGLISYPLYLFHWPALSFVHIVKGEKPADVYIAGALAVAFLLSVVTYYLVEKPIRFSKSKVTIPLLVAAFLITGLLGCATWMGIIKTSVNPDVQKVENALNDKNLYAGLKQHSSPVSHLSTGASGAQTLFLGDSNMEQYMPRIAQLMKNHSGNGRGAIFITCGGALPIRGYDCSIRLLARHLIPEFEERLESDPRIDRVVIAALWPFYFNNNDNSSIMNGMSLSRPEAKATAIRSFGNMIGKLTANGKKVTVVLCVPTGNELDPRFAIRRSFSGVAMQPPPVLLAENFRKATMVIMEEIKNTALSHGAEIIDPVDYLSDKGTCIFENADGPIRYNGTHLRPGFVRDHLEYLDGSVAP